MYTETFCLPYLTFVVLRELQCTYDEIKKNIYKVMDAHLPQANKLDWIMNFWAPCWPRNTFTKFWYKLQPSTLIQKNEASKKYCISAATNWQLMRGVTRLIPTKNNVSNANKEKDKHSKILDGSFFRSLLKKIWNTFFYR